MPLHLYLALVNRSLERLRSLSLRHAGHLCYVTTVVAVGTVGRMIYGEQITVAVAILCHVRVHATSMTVVGMAVQA